uniref:ATP synthase protein subunit 4 n=1 Tax=Kumanoa ambigua TaxID=644273 RepID=A0A343UXU9_9FLOR|nr:ATP synthase protein subunit 4 [Kumanoa ambigua]AVK39506.1 ATP synthase protein subunit 4 [Kumanoa ambigua]
MFIRYFVLLTLVLLVLVFHGILLLNEETLILICFTIFSWLFNRNVGNSIKKSLTERNSNIKFTIYNSLKEVTFSLNIIVNTKHKFWELFYSFKILVNHYLKLVNLIIFYFNNHNIQVLKLPFPKRLQFIFKIENQIVKLLSLILIKKIQGSVELKQFFVFKFNDPHFLCQYKINIQEYIQSIKL